MQPIKGYVGNLVLILSKFKHNSFFQGWLFIDSKTHEYI
jgi:hypothetical protein